MSETLASHSQWIRHAVAAAKAGNPSVAKIQLQKAAEEDPSDPTVWLWMGWLADSPANAAQCLEIARSDARFAKIAAAGIEFSKALADFQLDQFSEVNGETADDDESAPEVAEQKHQAKGPVEAVEDVVAAVESLQKEDTTETAVDNVDEEVTDAATDDVQLVDEVQTVDSEDVEPIASQPTDFQVDVEAAEGDVANVEAAEFEASCERLKAEEAESTTSDGAADADEITVAVQQSESTSRLDVEADLMRSANELWQTDDEPAAATSTSSEEVGQELKSDDQLRQPTVDDEADEAVLVSSPEVASQPEPKTAKVPEVILDESEDDFVFSDDDSADAEFEANGLREATDLGEVEPSPINVSVNPSLNPGDQWLGQSPVEAPKAPVWRKAQSDWFSVDGPTEPESAPQSTDLAVSSASSTPPLEQKAPASIEHPSVPVIPQSAGPRVTASDVWQTAAIEKSSMTKGTAPQSPTVGSVPAPGEFFAADLRIDQSASSGPAAATSPDRRTVLVVDDSPTVRKLVAITLEKRGYKVVSAFDGVAAIKEIAAHNPSLILMDVNMPRLDGYQLCKLVKKHETTRDIPVLMLTGKDGMFDRLRGRLVGCAGSIAKPFSPEELLEVVEQNILRPKS